MVTAMDFGEVENGNTPTGTCYESAPGPFASPGSTSTYYSYDNHCRNLEQSYSTSDRNACAPDYQMLRFGYLQTFSVGDQGCINPVPSGTSRPSLLHTRGKNHCQRQLIGRKFPEMEAARWWQRWL